MHGVCSESLEEICQEAIKWGNCFKFLTQFVTPKVQTGKLIQEGLIFKVRDEIIQNMKYFNTL